MKPKHLLFVLALGACEKSSSKPQSDKVASAPAGEVTDSVQKEPTPAAEPTFTSIVNGAEVAKGEKVDAAKLGDAVDIYLVTRWGGVADQDDQAQRQDLSLVLVGGGQVRRVELGRNDVLDDKMRPFGDLTATAPFPNREYDAEADGFNGAPKFKSKSPVLLAESIRDLSGDTIAHVVTREQDTLVVWSAEEIFEEGVSDKWTKEVTISLAKDATVQAPIATIAAPSTTDPTPVSVIEHLDGEAEGGYRYYSVALKVGDRVGQIADARAMAATDSTWVTGSSGLTDVPPGAQIAAFRVYTNGTDVDTLAIGRAGDDLVAWERTAFDGAAADWEETTRIALPAGTKLDFQAPVKVASVP